MAVVADLAAVTAVMTAAAFVSFWLYPVAPPRLLPASFGFVDTLRDGASGHLEGSLTCRRGSPR